MAGLTPERIGQVVEAHNVTEEEADAATDFAMDAINMMVEGHLSAKVVACALELLAHLRRDCYMQAEIGPQSTSPASAVGGLPSHGEVESEDYGKAFELFQEVVNEIGQEGVRKEVMFAALTDLAVMLGLIIEGEAGTYAMIESMKERVPFFLGADPGDDEPPPHAH